jgi:hypothetical protein
MTGPTWQDALLRYHVPRDLVTRARHAPFKVQSVGSALSVTPSSGLARPIYKTQFERSLPLLGHAGRAALLEASFNSSYIEAIVDDLRRSVGEGALAPGDAAWERYGRALHRAMAEVLEEFPEDVRPHALETADYWISVGVTIGLERPHQARRLRELIEAEEDERTAPGEDAAAFIEEALE